MKRHLARGTAALVMIPFLFAGCSGRPTKNRGIAADAGADESFDSVLDATGRHVYFANLHAHHFINDTVPTDWACKQIAEPSGAAEESGDASVREPASKKKKPSGPKPPGGGGSQEMHYDDGKPCHNDEQGVNTFVKFDTMLDYFKGACDYAREQGKLDILYISAHTKTGSDPQTDTTQDQMQERHQALAGINAKYDGKFLCGLGQEASSISKGNHFGIYGQFPIANAEKTEPFYFPAGAFDVLYPKVKERVAGGSKIILQMNHPDVHRDVFWPSARGNNKESNNDYGLDDFEPMKSARASGAPVTTELLQQTYATMREAAGDRFRLLEVAQTGGATENPSTRFISTQALMGKPKRGLSSSNLYDFIFYLNMGFKLAPTGNQDNHHFNYGTGSTTRTGVLAKSLKEEDVIDALDKRKVFATEDLNARVLTSVETDKEKAVMGDEMTTSSPTVRFSVAYQDPDAADAKASIRIFYYKVGEVLDFDYKADQNGVQRVVSFPGGFDAPAVLPAGPTDNGIVDRVIDPSAPVIESGHVKTFTIPTPAPDQYVFVELTQQGDEDRIWSAPIWIKRN